MHPEDFIESVFTTMRSAADGLNHPGDIMSAILSTAETLYNFVDSLPSAVDTRNPML